MFTWILLAVVVAAFFGLIDLNQFREWSVEKSKESWPHVESFFHKVGEKTHSAKATVENTKENLSNKMDQAKDKAEELKDDAKEKFDDFNNNY